jgi:hypothetical protein
MSDRRIAGRAMAFPFTALALRGAAAVPSGVFLNIRGNKSFVLKWQIAGLN